MLKTLTLSILALSVAMAGDPPDAPKKSEAELLYEKLLEANVKPAAVAYEAYAKALEAANKKIIAGLEATIKDLNDTKKFPKLDIAARAKMIEEVKAKIEEVKKGAIGEAVVERAKSSGDLLGSDKPATTDPRNEFIGKWKMIIPGKPSTDTLTIDGKFNATHSAGVFGKVEFKDNCITISWTNNTTWVLTNNGGDFFANGKIKLTK